MATSRRFALGSGTLLGVVIAVFALAFGGGLWARGVVNAQQASRNICFLAAECVGPDKVIEACTGKGCCSDERCFEPDATCDASGATKGAGHCYAKSQPVRLIVPIGSRQVVLDLGDYLAAIYTYALSVAGIFATVLMMIGGFQYLVGQRDKGISQMKSAVGGVLVTFFAYLILQTVNPDLVLLRLPKIQVVKRTDIGLCEYVDKLVPCGQRFGIKQDNGRTPTVQDLQALRVDQATSQNVSLTPSDITKYIETDQSKLTSALVIAQCVGRGCAVIGNGCSNDTQFKCGVVADPDTAPTPACGVSNSFGASCSVCKDAGQACSKSSECCGSCVSGKCQAGVMGQPCGLGATCAEGYHCVTDPSIKAMFSQVVSSGTTGICYAGGVGMLCSSGSDCKQGLSCEPAFGEQNFKICSPRPVVLRALPNPPEVKSDSLVGEAYGINYAGSNTGHRCREERHVPFFYTSTTSSIGSYILSGTSSLVPYWSYNAEAYEVGICTDGALFSACLPGNDQCLPGLKCVASIIREEGWTEYLVKNWLTRVGIEDGFKKLGVCLSGTEGSACGSTSDCQTGFSCTGGVCLQTTGGTDPVDDDFDTFVPLP